MEKRKFSTQTLALIVLLAVRFLGNVVYVIYFLSTYGILSFILTTASKTSETIFLLSPFPIFYFIALWGIYRSKKWGYSIAVVMTIIDILFVRSGFLSSASSVGAAIVDLIILILAVMEYQKFFKK